VGDPSTIEKRLNDGRLMDSLYLEGLIYDMVSVKAFVKLPVQMIISGCPT
jgi:hypothetical protein